MQGARENLLQQYKKIPQFDDLDESGLDAWELPDIGPGFSSSGSGGGRYIISIYYLLCCF